MVAAAVMLPATVPAFLVMASDALVHRHDPSKDFSHLRIPLEGRSPFVSGLVQVRFSAINQPNTAIHPAAPE
jgi:hypothetical protein